MSAVSLPAKNAASSSNATSAQNMMPSEGFCIVGVSSAPVSPLQILEHELRTKIGEDQHAETPERQAYRESAAPPVAHPPDQQHAEQHPGDQRQDGFVNQVLRE